MAESGDVTTYARFESVANQMAHLLRGSDLRRGDHIAFLVENDPALVMAIAGAERTGLIYTPISHHLSTEQIAYVVNDCRAGLVVVSSKTLPLALNLPQACPNVTRWLVANSEAMQLPHPFEALEPALAGEPSSPVSDERLGMAMMYSSGTSGRPKGVYRPFPDIAPGVETGFLTFAQKLLHMRPGMVYLSPAPLYHAAPQAAVSSCIRMGATAVIMRRFDAAEFLSAIETYRVTHTQVVPTMFSRLLALPVQQRLGVNVASLECVLHAAAPCPIAVKEQMIGWLGPIIVEYYSSTEANGATTCDSFEWTSHKGTVGRAILGEVCILDEKRSPCPPGTIGEIWFRGATKFEYFGDPDQTVASRDPSGEMSTVGDVGYLDRDGYLFLTDRLSMMIISGGVNVYPQETENVLLTHPSVEDAAVIGVPNPDLGEEVRGVVQVKSGVDESADLAAELVDYCRDRLSHIACPKSIDFDRELPRSPTGKLLKRQVRQRYWPQDESTLNC
jgi:acyl-CoA synthetase (AMP-forming)/AMP-acid ligase II